MKNRIEPAQTPIYNANPLLEFFWNSSESQPVLTCLLHHRIPETPNTVCQKESALETMTFTLGYQLTNHVSSFFSFYVCLHQKFPEFYR